MVRATDGKTRGELGVTVVLTTRTITTLKVRSDFQRVRGGGRASCAAFVLEGKLRGADRVIGSQSALSVPRPCGPRFGFTITKKIGNAVIRNKIRRRLRAALCEIASACARTDTDYVLIARRPAADQEFRSLLADLRVAFQRVHAPGKSLSNPVPKARPPDRVATNPAPLPLVPKV